MYDSFDDAPSVKIDKKKLSRDLKHYRSTQRIRGGVFSEVRVQSESRCCKETRWSAGNSAIEPKGSSRVA